MSDKVKVGDFELDEEVVKPAKKQEKKNTAKVDEPLLEKAEDYSVEEVLDTDEDMEEDIYDEELTPEQRRALIEAYFPVPEDFPSDDIINQWREKYGKLRIHRVSPGEAYVVRALSRPEYREYIDIISTRYKDAKEASSSRARMDQEEMLVEKCLLYPEVSTEDIAGRGEKTHKISIAGTISILAYDIEEISNLIEASIGPFEEL